MIPEITIKISFAASGDADVETTESTHAIAPPALPIEAAAEAPPPPEAVDVDEAEAGSSDDVPPPPTVDEGFDEEQVPSLPGSDADGESEN
jgi:hypothetical protein